MSKSLKQLRPKAQNVQWNRWWDSMWPLVATFVAWLPVAFSFAVVLPAGLSMLIGLIASLSIPAYGILFISRKPHQGWMRTIHAFWKTLLLFIFPLGFAGLAELGGVGIQGQIAAAAMGLGCSVFGLWLLRPPHNPVQLQLDEPGGEVQIKSLKSTLINRLGWNHCRSSIDNWGWDQFWNTGFFMPAILLWPIGWFLILTPVWGAHWGFIAACVVSGLCAASLFLYAEIRFHHGSYCRRAVAIRIVWIALALAALPPWVYWVIGKLWQASPYGLDAGVAFLVGVAVLVAAGLLWPKPFPQELVMDEPESDTLEEVSADFHHPEIPPSPQLSNHELQQHTEQRLLEDTLHMESSLRDTPGLSLSRESWNDIERRAGQGESLAASISYTSWYECAVRLEERIADYLEDLEELSLLAAPRGPFPEENIHTPLLILSSAWRQCRDAREYVADSARRVGKHMNEIDAASEEILREIGSTLDEVQEQISYNRELLRLEPVRAGESLPLIREMDSIETELKRGIRALEGSEYGLVAIADARNKIKRSRHLLPMACKRLDERIQSLQIDGGAIDAYQQAVAGLKLEALLVYRIEKHLHQMLDLIGLERDEQ